MQVCFARFGDRVKHWYAAADARHHVPTDLTIRLTFNEPWCTAVLGYGTGVFAPGRSSDRTRSSEGDSATEPDCMRFPQCSP